MRFGSVRLESPGCLVLAWIAAAAAWPALAGCGGGSHADGPPATRQAAVPPDVDGRVAINEIMVANALTAKDEAGGAGSWIELYNPGARDVPLAGYALTDDLARPRRVPLADALVIPAGGYLVLWLDGEPDAGPSHVGLLPVRAGGALGLARPDGSYIDRIVYGAQEVDFSAAREPDGAARWVIEWHPSPGAPNPGAGAGDGSAPAEPEQVPAAGDLSERILAYDVVPEFALTVESGDVAALLADPRTDVPAMLTFDGRSYGPVGLSVKGMNSFEPFDAKPSLRIDVNRYVDRAAFFGLKDLTLDNMHSDLSMMHERIAYRIAREARIPASRANHALVTVNGKPYGLYANVETIKGQMMSRWFANGGGPLFEATNVDFVAAYVPRYALQAGPDDRTLIARLAEALTVASPDAAIDGAAASADMAEFRRYWAFCSVIGQFDSFPFSVPGDDYFVYGDPAGKRLVFIPWGIDESFYSSNFDPKDVSSVLARQCRASAACFQSFVDETWAMLDMVEAMGWLAETERVAAQIAPLAAADRRKAYSDADVARYQGYMRQFITRRRSVLEAMLPARTR